MEYNTEELKILLKKISGCKAFDTKYKIMPFLNCIKSSLKNDDKIVTVEINCRVGLQSCLLLLLQDRIMYAEKITSHELYFENIASFQKTQTGNYCSIIISDAGNKTYSFNNISSKNANIIIEFLQKKQNNIDEIIKQNNDLPLHIEDYNKTLWYCACGGFLGIHRFYTGYKGIGIIQILLLFFAPLGLLLWWLIDFISISFSKFKTIDGFHPVGQLTKKRFTTAIPFLIIFLFYLNISLSPSYFMNKKDSFTIQELNNAIANINNYKDNSKKLSSDIFLYSDSLKTKNQYKYGFFKISQGIVDGITVYSKYGVVCNCDVHNKSITPFWHGLYNNSNNDMQEFNYIKTNELEELNPNDRENHKIMWQALCN